MSSFEQELEHRLQRVEAPEGFAHNVMARVREEMQENERQRRGRLWNLRWLWPALVAVTLLVCAGGGFMVHRQHERELAEINRAKFELAMQITSRTLARVDEHLSHAALHAGR